LILALLKWDKSSNVEIYSSYSGKTSSEEFLPFNGALNRVANRDNQSSFGFVKVFSGQTFGFES